jgi:hypothetical protein
VIEPVSPDRRPRFVDLVLERLEPGGEEAFLTGRLFQLSRPIRDASRETGSDLRLQDAGPFFLIVEQLGRLNWQRLEETLLILLDEFSLLDHRSYDELYLWSIVHLSRSDIRHVSTFWPQVTALDLRYRSPAWSRSSRDAVADQPYRLTELVCYFYVLYTLQRRSTFQTSEGDRLYTRDYQSLGTCLRALSPTLSHAQSLLLCEVLRSLAKTDRRPDFGDALGMFVRSQGGRATE